MRAHEIVFLPVPADIAVRYVLGKNRPPVNGLLSCRQTALTTNVFHSNVSGLCFEDGHEKRNLEAFYGNDCDIRCRALVLLMPEVRISLNVANVL